jgi:RND family efflux transporter MFP subunit
VAPFDGLVTEKLVDPGNMATPGMPLVTVEDTRSFRLVLRLDESRAVQVSVGDAVEVVLDAAAPGAPALAGRVAEVARMIDAGSHDFLVKVDLPQVEGLRSGMFARAIFTGPIHRALAVPESAVVRTGQLSFVYVVEDSRAHRRLINAGTPVRGLVEVRSGLVNGERVVTVPPADLTDGRAVTAAGEPRR